MAEILRMLGLCEERYEGFTVKHFHEQLQKRHDYKLGYTVTRLSLLQSTGLVEPALRRSAHRQKQPRRPMIGVLLHQDASRSAWPPGDARQYDLVVTLDDATSEIYSAFLVEEEGTASSFRGLCAVIAQHGLFCELYTDRGSPLFRDARAGEPVSKTIRTQVGRALAQLGNDWIAEVYLPAQKPPSRWRRQRPKALSCPIAPARPAKSCVSRVGSDNTVKSRGLSTPTGVEGDLLWAASAGRLRCRGKPSR